MNNTIWKYELPTTDQCRIELPIGANILCVQSQNNKPCLWAEVSSLEKEHAVHIIETFGTGHNLDSNPRKYIGTYQLHNGSLVFHVYEYLGV